MAMYLGMEEPLFSRVVNEILVKMVGQAFPTFPMSIFLLTLEPLCRA